MQDDREAPGPFPAVEALLPPLMSLLNAIMPILSPLLGLLQPIASVLGTIASVIGKISKVGIIVCTYLQKSVNRILSNQFGWLMCDYEHCRFHAFE